MATVINLEDIHPDIADAAVIELFIKADEETGAVIISDATGNVTVASDAVTQTSGRLDVAVALNTALTSGTIAAPGAATDFAVMAVMQKVGTVDGINIGDSSNNHYISIGTSGSSIVGATGTASLSAVTGTDPKKVLLTADASGNSVVYQAVIGAALAAGTPATYSTHGNVTTIDSVMTIDSIVGGANTRLWGLLYCVFPDDLPADIVAMSDWMMEQWYANNKDFYPRLTEI
jgi:hypothetical protein